VTTSGERIRQWRGPALFSFGFRPFFLGAGAWAVFTMTLWMLMLTGNVVLPSNFDPVSWHAHEFLFGYLGAVLAGFLLTAVPNWTGRLPIVGWPLATLFALWILGRVAVLCGEMLAPWLVAVADLAFPVVLIVAIGIETVLGRNWRNGIVLAAVTVFAAGNALYHLENAAGEAAQQEVGLRLGLAASVMMIAIIGGRIVPSFTRNWLAKRQANSFPAAPMGKFDRIALLILFVSLVAWVAAPTKDYTGAALIAAGIVHLARLARWKGETTIAEPLLLILHVGYSFVPLGALALAYSVFFPDRMGSVDAQHLWMAGAIGIMTIAVMTRAILGHSGQALTAGNGTVLVYGAIALSVVVRFGAGWVSVDVMQLYSLSGLCWILGYLGFLVLYGSHLMTYGNNARSKSG